MKSPLHRTLPLLGQLGDDYVSTGLRGDLTAGLTTAIMLIPQAMAYAMLAGLEPIVGLYASTVPLFVYGLLGTSRQLAVGPVAMVSLLVASGVGAIAGDDLATYTALAATLALMVGAMQWAMGVFKIGFLVKFLSHPVIAGFTSAAALIIGFSQLKHVLGVPIPRSHHFYETVLHAIELAPGANPVSLAISAAAIITLVALKRFAPRFPRFLLVVVGGAAAVYGLGLEGTVGIVGDVPSGLPMPTAPSLGLSDLQALLPTAITISLVGFMESISVAKNFARQNRYEVDPDQELKALGLANIFGSVLQAYPVTGGFSRTAVNAQAGARTGVASIVTGAAVVVTLLFFTPLFYYLPKAVLASIIMTAVFGLIDLREARHLWQVSRPDLAAMAVTFVATLTLGIEQGILVGVAVSLLWFVWSTSKPHVAVLGRVPGTNIYRNKARYPDAVLPEGVVAVRIDAPLYFANTAFLKATIMDAIDDDTEHLVVDCKAIGSVDAQALSTIEEIIDELTHREIRIWVAGVHGPVRDALASAHLLDEATREQMTERVHEALDRIEGRALRVVGQ